MGRFISIFLSIAVLVTALTGASGIYRWTDENGRVHYTDSPPAKKAEEVELGPINTYEAPSKILIDETLARPISKSRKRTSVVVYSTTWCGVCTRAKQWLQANRIRYTEYDVEKSERGKQDFKRLGGGGVPVILVGQQRMNGFSAERMRQMLRTAGYNI